MIDQLPDDSPSRPPPEHPTDPPDEPEIKSDQKAASDTGTAYQAVKVSFPRAARHLLS